MRTAAALCMLALAAALPGCRATPETNGSPLGYGTDPLPTVPGTRYFSPGNAPASPEIMVTSTPKGPRPQELITAMPGYVTIVVFSGMFMNADKAALRHARDIRRKYRQNIFRLRVVGVIEPTRFYEQAERFAAEQRLGFPLYYDNTKSDALRQMLRAVGERNVQLPAIFLIDREGRIRLCRLGFKFAVVFKGPAEPGARPDVRPGEEEVSEARPRGQRVTDYVELLLDER